MKKIFKLLWEKLNEPPVERLLICLLYTSDAADE